MRVPKRRGEEDRKWRQQTDYYITQAKYDALMLELQTLKTSAQPNAKKELQRAQEMGDLSENAAYTEAKWKLRQINNRILNLDEQLKQAQIIQPGSDHGVIRIGSVVTLQQEKDCIIYEIVGSKESDPARGRISHLSPLGTQLIGRKKGQELIFNNRHFIIAHVE